MAEMETYHTQKGEDFITLTKEHLDGEIAFYEQARTQFCCQSMSHLRPSAGVDPSTKRTFGLQYTAVGSAVRISPPTVHL
jgi:hypothetical protein